jgi:hypothetical protein
MASKASPAAEAMARLTSLVIIGFGVYLVMGGWNHSDKDAVAISTASSFETKGIPVVGGHLTTIQGSMTNNFGRGDAWCDSGEFELIGRGQTIEAASGSCAASRVAPGTRTTFALMFPVQDAGEYELRFERFTANLFDTFMQKYETHTIVIK